MIKKSTLNHRHKLYQPLPTTVLHLQHRNYLPFKREGKNTQLLAWYFRIDHTDQHALFQSKIYKIFLTKEISCASQNLHWDHSDTGRVEHVRCNLLIRNDNHSYTHSDIDGGASGSSLDSVSYPETLQHPGGRPHNILSHSCPTNIKTILMVEWWGWNEESWKSAGMVLL